MEKYVIEKYIKERCSEREIAKKEGISRGSVRYWLKKHNVKTISKTTEIDKGTFIKRLLINAPGKKRHSTHMKSLLFKFELKSNCCEKCGLNDEWQGKKIVLHLEHINGNHFDNRLENLKILCPNCHSQTETYSKRKVKSV